MTQEIKKKRILQYSGRSVEHKEHQTHTTFKIYSLEFKLVLNVCVFDTYILTEWTFIFKS